MSPETSSDTQDAKAFLYTLRPDGPHNLVAIDPDSGAISAVTSSDFDQLAEFVDRFNGKRNLYYSVNRPRAGAGNKKLTKGDIEACEFLYVDIDPPPDGTKADIDLDAIRESDPSFIVDSGNGYNVLWRIDPTGAETAEAHGRGLVKRYGGDPGVWDAPRILRLPGTMNLPNAKKRKAGRVKSQAKLIHRDLISSHVPSDLAPAIAQHEKRQDYTADFSFEEASQYLEWDDLPAALCDRLERARMSDEALALHLDNKNPGGDDTRSGVSFRIAEDMHRLGFPDQEIANVLFAHPELYGAEWEARRMRDAINNSAPDYSAFGLDPAQVDAIMNGKPPAQTKDPGSAIVLIKADEVRISTKPRYLIKDVLDQDANAVIYGKSNTGKSFLALDMAWSIATGAPWGGRKVRQGAVVYFAAEAGRGFGYRVAAVRGQKGPDNAPLMYSPSALNLLASRNNPQLQRAEIDRMLAAIRETESAFGEKVKLVVIDTLAKVMSGGNENSSEDMTGVADAISKIGSEAQCSTLTVHHSGKNAAAGMRGHSSLQAAIETELEVRRSGKDETSGPGFIRTPKQREMSKAGNDIGFSLRTVLLETDDEGDNITSCVAVVQGDTEFDAINLGEITERLNGKLGLRAAYESLLKVLAQQDRVTAAAWAAQWVIDTRREDKCPADAETLSNAILTETRENPPSLAAILGPSNTALAKRFKKLREELEKAQAIRETTENQQVMVRLATREELETG